MPNSNDTGILVNTFQDGMNTDLSELATKRTQLTYAKNCKFITNAGNQLILQKEDGTKVASNLDDGYLPLAVKELGDISYIISHNKDTGKSQIGTFPSPDYGEAGVIETYQPDWGSHTISLLNTQTFTIGIDLTDTPGAIDNSLLADYKVTMSVWDWERPVNIIYPTSGANMTVTLEPDDRTTYTFSNITDTNFTFTLVYANSGTNWRAIDAPKVYEYTISAEAVPLIQEYSPLQNFYAPTDIIPDSSTAYTDWLDTELFGLNKDSAVDMELQLSYDNSVNIIFTDDSNPVRLINSRFSANEDGTSVTIIDREGTNDTNVYSSLGFRDTELIPVNEVVPELELVSIDSNGKLTGGAYKYYFKLIDRDGIETNIVQESLDVHVHHGNTPETAYGAFPDETTNKSVTFKLTNLSVRYSKVKVYFSVAAGETSAVVNSYFIDSDYIISNKECTITHSGYESIQETTAAEISIAYSAISTGKTLDSVNNRLAIANTTAEYTFNDSYASIARTIYPECTFLGIDDGDTNSKDTYANPYFSYHNSGYHPEETYEFGIVFESYNGLSAVYPVLGSYDGMEPASNSPAGGFIGNGNNARGVYRTLSVPIGTSYGITNAIRIRMNCKDTVSVAALIAANPELTGFFFVRRERVPDRLGRGFLTGVTAFGLQAASSKASECFNAQQLIGYQDNSLYANSRKFVPCPGMIIPQGIEYVTVPDKYGKPSEEFNRSIDFTLTGVNPPSEGRFAMYVPDVDCSTAVESSKFGDQQVGLKIHLGTTLPFTESADTGSVDTYVSVEFEEGIGAVSAEPIYTPYLLQTRLIATAPEYLTDDSCKLSFVPTKQNAYSNNSFASNAERNYWAVWAHPLVSDEWNDDQVTDTNNTICTQLYSKGTGMSGRGRSEFKYGDTEMAEVSGLSVYYGQYVGISDLDQDDKLNNHLRYYDYPSFTSSVNAAAGNWDASFIAGSENKKPPSLSFTGAITDIYPEGQTEALDSVNWEARYTTTSGKYFPISHRYPINYLTDSSVYEFVQGGDAYVGRMYKQVYHPTGNTKAQTATDIVTYALESEKNDATRYALGMLQYGLAITYPALSKYNFYIRTKEEETDSALDTLYGDKKSFLPLRGIDKIRGHRQFETTTFNAGYVGSNGVTNYYQLDDNPFYSSEFANRIYVSDVSTTQEFSNSFRSFKGLNFRDYNKEFGPIIKIAEHKGNLVAVFESGIVSIGVDERSMVSQDTGGVYTDSAVALAQKSNIISPLYGTRHMSSISKTPNFVYGVDYSASKVWKTDGQSIKIISDVTIQKLLSDIKSVLGQDVAIHTSHDENSHNIFFTFTNKTGTERTIMYSELLEIWVSTTDSHRSFTAAIKDQSYMLNRYEGNSINLEVPDFANYISDFSGNRTQYDSVIEFVVYNTGASEIMLNNLVNISNNNIPYKIDYTSEHMSASQAILPYTNVNFDLGWTMFCADNSYDFTLNLNGHVFEFAEGDILNHPLYGNIVISKIRGYNSDGTTAWLRAKDEFTLGALSASPTKNGAQRNLRNSNATFENGNVRIVSQPDNKNTRQSLAQRLTNKSSRIRGKWIKVSITYTGCDKLYLNSVLSYTTGSYS